MGRRNSPVPYISKKDVIQEAIDSSASMLKLTLPHKVKSGVPVWSKGTPVLLLVHVQQALDLIRQKGLLTAYEKVGKDKEEWTKMLTKATEAWEIILGGMRIPPRRKR